MAKIVSATRSKNGSAWLDVTMDDGTILPIEDPSGEEERRIRSFSNPPKETAGMAGPMAQAAQSAGIDIKPKSPDMRLAQNAAPVGSAFGPDPFGDAVGPTEAADFLQNAAPYRPTQPAAPAADPSANPLEQAAAGLGLQVVRRAPTAGRMQPNTQTTTVQGPMEEDRAEHLRLSGEAIDLRTQAGEAEIEARRSTALHEAMRGSVARDDARQKLADIGNKVSETERIRRLTSERMNKASKVPENPLGLFERSNGWFTVLASIAAMAGGMRAGLQGGRNEGLENIMQLLDMDVQSQRENKSALLQDYERQLGDSDAALSLLRADMAEAVAKETEGMKRTDMAADQIAGLSAISKALLADAAEKRSAAEAATMRQVSMQETEKYVAGTPGGVQVVNMTQEQLKQLGITPEQHQKALASKIGGGENAPTVGEAITAVQGVNQDLAALEALAPNGTLPNKLVWNDLSQLGRRALTYLFGADVASRGAVSAEEVDQMVTRRIIEEAKKMGGVITENDLKFTERVAGHSLQAKKRWFGSVKDTLNNKMRTTVVGHMPGVEQPWLDIVLGRQAATQGVPGAPSLRPR